ncbi:glycerate kinase [Bacillus sp. 1P02SD]|uniref:glycerate kinase n=1 Tax=Bacillus sp. 1P02SD TaxID=3132264 RepID=UPI0039A1A234
MKVLIAIDSFKGSISSLEGSNAIALGIEEVYPDATIITIPLADGGEGTVESFIQATNGEMIETTVTGPLMEKISAMYGILGDKKTAVIEVAAACGLPLVPSDKRNPKLTTTFGVGELILDACHRGCREFVIGLGGSSTNDAGVGMLQALGFRFLDNKDQEVGCGGQHLKDISKIDASAVHPIVKECTFRIACDVNNPLYGPNGAAYIYGPQKGADETMVAELDDGLKHFSKIVLQTMNINIHSFPGAGAAGGLGAAFSGFLQGQLVSGVELVLDSVGMNQLLEGVDFVITGEGKMDGQTSMGKAPLGVAKRAQQKNIPVIALAGAMTGDTSALNELGITSFFSIINEPMTLDEAMNTSHTFENLKSASSQIFRLIKAVKG